MVRLLALLLMFHLFMLPPGSLSAAPGAPGEMLPNGSFEQDADGNGVPDGWTINRFDTESTVQLDNTVAHTGKHSIRIDGDAKGRAGVVVGFRGKQVEVNAAYLLSGWVKGEGESASSYGTSVRITSVGADGSVLKSDYRVVNPVPRDWAPVEWLVALPEGTTSFNLVFFHHGEGKAWWDDVSLRRAQPVRAVAPAQDALVPDARPTFQWEATGAGTLEITAVGGPGAVDSRRYAVTGGRFTLPEPLPTNREYRWRVITTEPDGTLRVTLAPGEDKRLSETPRLFAGTWEERMKPLSDKLAGYRELLGRLRALAQRNRMWDSFSLLARTLEQGEKMLATVPANPRQAQAELDALLAELEYTLPWWEKIFLDDAALFDGLDLGRPGLERVKAAVARQEWPAARQALLDYYRTRKGPSYYARYEDAPRRNPAVTTNSRADALLTHQFEIHSYKEPTFDLGADFNWHVRPIIDIEWPTKIHRHFHWTPIAAAYRQTGNEKYAEELVQQLLDWAKDNPMERWDPERRRWSWSTLNTTIRIYSTWINSWLQIKDAAAWNADAQFVLLTGLREHGRFLMANAAKHGNWVVAEARGLVELGVMFPEFKEAKAWRDEGYRRLQNELAVQVLSDGVHVERTPGYHSMTMGCFMEPVRLGLLNKVEVPGRDEFVSKLEKMHEYYLYGVKPDGRMEQIGDGGMMAVAGELRRGWEMFRREDMQWVLTNGKEGKPPVHRSYAFDGAGFYISRSAWNDPQALWSMLDWGGFLGHCHEDMGQVSLHAYGRDLLIDTGRYSYDRTMRQPFYQTVGHNTVMVDGQTQKHRDPLSAHWVSTDQFDFFTGTTDNSEPLIHERSLAFRQPNEAGPGYWLVVDRLTGEGTHRLDQRWHTTESMAMKADAANVLLTGKKAGQPSLVIANLPQPGLKTAVVEGAVSYEWYKKIPVDVAQFTLETEMPARFVTVLYPTPTGQPPAQVSVAAVAAESDGGAATAVVVTIVDQGRTYRDLWLLNHAGKGTLRAAGVETDARLAMLREENGRTSWLLADGALLRRGAETLFSAREKVSGAGVVAGTEGANAVCTAGSDIRIAATGAVTLNGAAFTGERVGNMLQVPTVAARVVPPAPKAPGEPRFEVELQEEMKATSFLKVLPLEEKLPAGALRIEAEALSAQGGGAVEVTTDRVGASGASIFHWDHAGHWLEWKANVPQAGRYLLYIRACSSEARALRRLTVNGRTPRGTEAMEIAGTTGWSREQDDWRTFLVTDTEGAPLALALPAGETTLRLENIDGESLNLDWLALQRQ